MYHIDQPYINLTCGKHFWESSVFYQSLGPKGKTTEEPNIPECPDCGHKGRKLAQTESVTIKLTKSVNSLLRRVLISRV